MLKAGWQPWFFIVTRMMPPERSVFQFLPSASFCSSGVSSFHQPSFRYLMWSNSVACVMSAPLECEPVPGLANDIVLFRTTPKFAREVAAAVHHVARASVRLGEPGA